MNLLELFPTVVKDYCTAVKINFHHSSNKSISACARVAGMEVCGCPRGKKEMICTKLDIDFTTVTLSFDWLVFAVKFVWRAAEPGKSIFTTLETEFYHGGN